MTVPWYPPEPELPRPLREGYSISRGDGRTVSRQDAGPPTRRRRFSAVPNAVAFSTYLTRSQMARFDRFYDEDTKQGTLPFLMPAHAEDGLPLLDGSGTPLLTGAGIPILIARTWLCVFGDQLPVQRMQGIEWHVSFGLVVLP